MLQESGIDQYHILAYITKISRERNKYLQINIFRSKTISSVRKSLHTILKYTRRRHEEYLTSNLIFPYLYNPTGFLFKPFLWYLSSVFNPTSFLVSLTLTGSTLAGFCRPGLTTLSCSCIKARTTWSMVGRDLGSNERHCTAMLASLTAPSGLYCELSRVSTISRTFRLLVR